MKSVVLASIGRVGGTVALEAMDDLIAQLTEGRAALFAEVEQAMASATKDFE